MSEVPMSLSSEAGRWKPKTAETVARRVVQTIVSAGLTLGDKLPREAEMVEYYGVGRETLREALRLLETQGLITLRRGPGGGPVVASAEAVNLGRISTLYFQMTGATYVELVEAWALAEGLLAERAARNPDAALRAQVMAPYLQAAPAPADTATVDTFMSMHTGFHDALGHLGRNRVLHLSLSSFGQIVSYQAGVIDDPRLLRQLIHDDHGKLARAVAAGHHRAARVLMQSHIEGVWDYCRAHLANGPDEPVQWL
jgi:GntR family transcriptional regulator, transcriptional repressor for pyruvate dehydrogenase complex